LNTSGHNAEMSNKLKDKYNDQINKIVDLLVQAKTLQEELSNEIGDDKEIELLKTIIHYKVIKS
jgi:hypothetical protein